jgi:hypothetical protein
MTRRRKLSTLAVTVGTKPFVAHEFVRYDDTAGRPVHDKIIVLPYTLRHNCEGSLVVDVVSSGKTHWAYCFNVGMPRRDIDWLCLETSDALEEAEV